MSCLSFKAFCIELYADHKSIPSNEVFTFQAILDGLMPLDFALQKLAFMPANNQYCFCTEKSLAYLKFIESQKPE